MKLKFPLLLFFIGVLYGHSQNTYVPDDNFEQALIDLGYDSGALDDYVPTANINSVTNLNVSNKNITSLIGIEDFTAITWLFCNDNLLTTLDVSQNVLLEKFICRNNRLTNLNVSQNTSLTWLDSSSNQLTNMDVSNNIGLNRLYLDNNLLTNLDVTSLTNLWILNFNYNSISTIDLTLNLALITFECRSNLIQNLDFSQHSYLRILRCSFNNLETLNIRNGNNTNFTVFYAFLAGNNPNLNCIEVDDAAWSTTNWTDIDATASFSENCHFNETFVPDDNFEQQLINLGYDSGTLNDYVPTANIDSLVSIDLEDQGIIDLTGIEDFTALQTLYCQTNQITNLDLSSNLNLTTLVCNDNLLTNLNLAQNINLTHITCSNNQLSNLTIGNPNILTELHISNNIFTNFDGSGLISLVDFRCQSNQLTTLNIANGNNINFTVFNATNNPNLTCIQVDDTAYSTTNWTNIDTQTGFNENCSLINNDSFEPNNDFAQAYNLNLCSLSLPTIGESGDVDYFIIPVEQNLNTELKIEDIPVGLTCSVTLYTNNQTQHGTSFLTTNTQPLTQYLFSPINTFFYVKIESINANYNINPYKIAITNLNCSLGLEELDIQKFQFYPNPVINILTIESNVNSSYQLLDYLGKIIKNGTLINGHNTIELQSLSKGIYYIKIDSEIKKIIKN